MDSFAEVPLTNYHDSIEWLLDEVTQLSSGSNGTLGSLDVADVSSLTQAQTNENNQSNTYLDGQNNIYSQLAVQNNHYQQQDMCLLTNDMNKIADFPSSYTSNGYDVNLQSNYSQYFDDTLSNFKPIYEQSMCQPTYENQIQETYIPTYHQLPYQQENISSVYQQAFEPEYGNIQPIYQLQNNHPIYQQENINPSWSLPSYDMSFGPNEANTNIECLPSTTALPEAPLASGSGMIAFKEEPIIPLVLKNPPPMSMNDDFSPQAKNFILHDDEGHNFPIRIQVRVLQEATDQNTQKQYMLIPIIGDLPEGNDFNFIDLKSEVIERINTLSQGKSILLPLGIENAMNQGIRITRRSPVQMTTERCFDSSGISSTFSSPTNTEDCQVVRPATMENLVIPEVEPQKEPMDNLHSDLAVPHRKQIRKRKQSFDKLNKDNNIIIEYGYRRQRSYTASNEGYASTDEDPSSDDECSQISKRSRTGGLQKSDSSEWIEIAENLTKTAVICNGSQESVPDSLPELSKDKTKKSVKPEKEQKIKRATKIVLKLKEKKVADKSVDGDSKKIQELSKNEKKLAEKVEVQKSRSGVKAKSALKRDVKKKLAKRALRSPKTEEILTYNCPYCKKEYRSAQHLATHNKVIHCKSVNGAKPKKDKSSQ